jgi:hypothetical protein
MRMTPIPWHYEHSQCDAMARICPNNVASFLVVLQHNTGRTLVPMEQTIIDRCAMCCILSKISPYVADHNRKYLTGSFTVRRTRDGVRECLCIEAEHGIMSHGLLQAFLDTIERGDMVEMTVL